MNGTRDEIAEATGWLVGLSVLLGVVLVLGAGVGAAAGQQVTAGGEAGGTLEEAKAASQSETLDSAATGGIQANASQAGAEVTITRPEFRGTHFRGGIATVELAFEGTDVATLTFGDRPGVMANVTVVDADDSGTATVYLNTYQFGHGPVAENGTTVEHRPAGVSASDWENRQHGFFTAPGDNSTAIDGNVVAHPSTTLYGGSQGGGVIAPGTYELTAAPGTESPIAPGVERTASSRIEIRSRMSARYSFSTSTVASDFLDLETGADFDTALDDGTLRSVDGTMREGAALAVNVQTAGLTGVLHEAAIRHGNNQVEPLLNSTTDGLRADLFRAAIETTINGEPLLDLDIETTPMTGSDSTAVPVFSELTSVILARDEVNPYDRHILLFEVGAQGEDGDGGDIEPGETFDTTISLEPSFGSQKGPEFGNDDVISGLDPLSTESSEALPGWTLEAGATFTISTIEPSATEIEQGEGVTMEVTVQNTGSMRDVAKVTLTLEDIAETRQVELGEGNSGTVTFQMDSDSLSAGDYSYSVATAHDQVTETLTVTGSDAGDDDTDDETDDDTNDGSDDNGADDNTDDSTNDTTDDGGTDDSQTTDEAGETDNTTDDADDSGPGFGIAGALAALTGAGFLLRRRLTRVSR